MSDVVRPQIAEIFADIFQYDDPIDMGTSHEDIQKWDSLQHIALVTSIEEKFAISLSMDEMHEITNVRDIHNVLLRHGI
jgi:acyl carrier protein